MSCQDTRRQKTANPKFRDSAYRGKKKFTTIFSLNESSSTFTCRRTAQQGYLIKCIRAVEERFTKGEAAGGEAANFPGDSTPPRAATNPPTPAAQTTSQAESVTVADGGARPRPAAAVHFRAKLAAAPLPDNCPEHWTGPGARGSGTSDPPPEWPEGGRGSGVCKDATRSGPLTPGAPEPHLSAAAHRGPRRGPLRRWASGSRPDC